MEKETKKEPIIEILDGLTEVLVDFTQQLLSDTIKKNVSKEIARNIVGKVGYRILMGKEVFDKILEGSESEDNKK